MSYFIMKDFKVYTLGDKTHVIAYRGDDNNVFPKNFKAIHFQKLKGNREDLKHRISSIYNDGINTKAFVNLRSEDDFVKLALENAGGIKEFKKIPLKITFREPDDDLSKVDKEIYDLENSWSIDVGESIAKRETHKIKDNLKFMNESGNIGSCFAKKGLRNTVQTALGKRFIVTDLENIMLEMKVKGLKQLKLEFQKKEDRRYGWGKTFYIRRRESKIEEDKYIFKKRINSGSHYIVSKGMIDRFKDIELIAYI